MRSHLRLASLALVALRPVLFAAPSLVLELAPGPEQDGYPTVRLHGRVAEPPGSTAELGAVAMPRGGPEPARPVLARVAPDGALSLDVPLEPGVRALDVGLYRFRVVGTHEVAAADLAVVWEPARRGDLPRPPRSCQPTVGRAIELESEVRISGPSFLDPGETRELQGRFRPGPAVLAPETSLWDTPPVRPGTIEWLALGGVGPIEGRPSDRTVWIQPFDRIVILDADRPGSAWEAETDGWSRFRAALPGPPPARLVAVLTRWEGLYARRVLLAGAMP